MPLVRFAGFDHAADSQQKWVICRGNQSSKDDHQRSSRPRTDQRRPRWHLRENSPSSFALPASHAQWASSVRVCFAPPLGCCLTPVGPRHRLRRAKKVQRQTSDVQALSSPRPVRFLGPRPCSASSTHLTVSVWYPPESSRKLSPRSRTPVVQRAKGTQQPQGVPRVVSTAGIVFSVLRHASEQATQTPELHGTRVREVHLRNHRDSPHSLQI